MSAARAEDRQAAPDPPEEIGGPAVVLREFIYPLDDRPTPECHASTIAALLPKEKGGEPVLAAAWFGGSYEKHDDVGIWFSRKTGASAWSKPVQLVDGSEGEEQDYPCWNPVLYGDASPPLLLFYKVGPSPSTWWGMVITSEDGGETWSEPKKLGENPILGAGNPNLIGPVKNKPIAGDGGYEPGLLCPSSSEHSGWRIHFEEFKYPHGAHLFGGPVDDPEGFQAIQPTILQHEPRDKPYARLQALCRTQKGVIAETWSEDGGRTWSPLSGMSLPNPNAGIDAVTLRRGLDDVRHLLVYNHSREEGPFPAGRNILNVAVSEDGKEWKPVLTLERSEGEFSYPAVIQVGGLVHITYTHHRKTIAHVVLDPEKL